MADARPEEAPDDEEIEDALDLDLDGMKLRGDVDGILDLAKAYRSGKAPGGRDLKKCYEAYKVAAELGSGDGDYAVALFHLTGGVVSQDLKEGTTRLRAAAEKGSVPAKVYLGNLYELGIFYKADKEKADVWYRNAARGAHVESDPGSDDYKQELAELGCARYVLALTSGDLLDEADKARLLQRAKAHGYGLRIKDDSGPLSVTPGDRPTLQAALEGAEKLPDGLSEKIRVASVPPPAPAPAKDDAKKAAAEKKPKPAGPTQAQIALGAFGYALLFVLAGAGAGYAAVYGAEELIENGTKLPLVGTQTEYVFPIVCGVLGVLPAGVGYKLGAWLKALIMGAAMAGVGWVAWGTGKAALHASRPIQASAFALAGFLAALFVLGLLGGTKKQPPRAPTKKKAL
ncbi:MAG: sel1 repeat family protein [Labilithrix sp.]|nr:sel1 repeat family protein [Labilithrix sp.]MCW5814422.1 sel1 repeat family protein [Labilithrix sp.]